MSSREVGVVKKDSFSPLRKHLEDFSKASPVLPWDRFSNWVYCACVVTFDLELGQAMEIIYPAHIKLTEKEAAWVTLSFIFAFASVRVGSIITQPMLLITEIVPYHCKVRKRAIQLQTGIEAEIMNSDNAYYYGYVYFRQTKDNTIRRGYFQKSLVLLSTLPFVTLFTQLVSIIAPEYFENGEPSLEAACHDIDQWSSPVPGDTFNLPIFGTVLQPILPAHSILPSLHEIDIYSAFQTVLPHVQMMWELVLTGEPLIVMAASPSVASKTVQALINLINPLKYCSDHRPYFTIHDSEFKEYTTRTQAPPPVILGVTNPFFAKTLQHWPHIIRIGEMLEITSSKSFNKLKRSSSLKTLDSKPGVYTRYKTFLNKDKAILKRIVKGAQSHRPVEVQNVMLRRYFLELTQSFMIPLERYVASLMPLQRNISPHKGAPCLRPFDPDEFLKTVEQSGPQLTSGIKGDWEGLYRRFFRCSNFEGWYCQRVSEVNQKLQVLHMEALCDANLSEWIQDKQEVEVVDLILRLKDKLKFALTQHVVISKKSIQTLHQHIDVIISSLPEDLQIVLRAG